jgi:plastocyanin
LAIEVEGLAMRFGKWISIALIGTAAALCARGQETPTTHPGNSIVRGQVTIKGGGLFSRPDRSRVVVFIQSTDQFDKDFGPTGRATVAQQNKAFVPNFVIVPRGTDVEFPNLDHFDHNVFSRSAAAPAFDLDRYPYGMSKTRTFDKLGVVQVFCNVHPDMRAVIYVVPNRFFARADKEGNFAIGGLPAGTYQIVAWQERCDEQRQIITVSPDRPAEITFSLAESREKILSSSEDRHESYGVERGLGVKREQLNLPVVTEVHPAPPTSRP